MRKRAAEIPPDTLGASDRDRKRRASPGLRDLARSRGPKLAIARTLAPALGLALTLTSSCVPNEGIVELNWVFVDRNQQPVYPGETLTSCSFTGSLAAGEDAREFGLHVELSVCDTSCAAGCADEACVVHEERFSCQTARGTARVPTFDDSTYTFQTEIVAIEGGDETSACFCTLRDECALTPGPRARTVRAGLVTDLQVYQFVLPELDLPSSQRPIALDLGACCDPSPGCS